MFVGGIIGFVLGIIILVMIDRGMRNLSQVDQKQEEAIKRLAELMWAIDREVTRQSKDKSAKSVNDKRFYRAILSSNYNGEED